MQVFISYLARDRPVADDLAAKLNEAGIATWFDSQIEIGQRWREELIQQLNQSSAVIVIFSPNSLESTWVQNEWSTVLDKSRRVIPVLVGGVRPADIEGVTPNLEFVDLGQDYDRGIQKIITTLQSVDQERAPSIATTVDVAKLIDERLDKIIDARIDRRLRQLGITAPSVNDPHQIDDKLVFVVTAYSPDMEPAFEAIKAAAESVSLYAERVMDVQGDYKISDQIMDMIKRAYLVVADLTHERPNAYFELGYARGLGKRLITIAREGTEIHFDVHHWTLEQYADSRPLEAYLTERFQYELRTDNRKEIAVQAGASEGTTL